jgi:hypothetical protein
VGARIRETLGSQGGRPSQESKPSLTTKSGTQCLAEVTAFVTVSKKVAFLTAFNPGR